MPGVESPILLDFDRCRLVHAESGRDGLSVPSLAQFNALLARVEVLETSTAALLVQVAALEALLANSTFTLTATGPWFYNAESGKWNQLTVVGAESAEQTQLSAPAAAPA
jgi:hypothetical protein